MLLDRYGDEVRVGDCLELEDDYRPEADVRYFYELLHFNFRWGPTWLDTRYRNIHTGEVLEAFLGTKRVPDAHQLEVYRRRECASCPNRLQCVLLGEPKALGESA